MTGLRTITYPILVAGGQLSGISTYLYVEMDFCHTGRYTSNNSTRSARSVVKVRIMREHTDNKIKCDCCGTETLAEVKGDKLIIIDRRHGKKHVVVLTLVEILNMMRCAMQKEPEADKPENNEEVKETIAGYQA